ncbi:hypothetical protein [Chryseobacterium echinoideorum]|uniref:hypothetical protein n=1 Tax=Chryseobacterium echinoideorum TaxID=1549648 RepID=UPI001E2E0E14|nr:hypothetical protein [Chryseobacterium echinoideorum]
MSCYTYQVKKPNDTSINNDQDPKEREALAMQTKNNTAESQKLNSQLTSAPVNIQEKLAPNKNFKIDVEGRKYKIIVDRWENDSLVAHPVGKPDRILKFHKNQIDGEKIAEKRFSQPIADIITVTVYAGIGVAIWSLLQ